MKPAFVTIVGSKLYGISTPQSDIDFKGFGFAEIDEIVGLKHFEQQEYSNHKPDGPEKVEGVIYDIRRYIHLCLKANPTVIEIAFADPAFHQHATEIGKEVAEFVRTNMLTQRLFPAYSAYHRAQLRKLQSMERTGKRKDLVEKHGYDPKFAGHAYRLARQCCIVLSEGVLRPTLDPADREMCLKIRNGEFTKDECLKILQDVDVQMYEEHKKTSIPVAPDFNKANKFVCDLTLRYLKGEFDSQLFPVYHPFDTQLVIHEQQ
jgi:hypothetical protein